MPQPANLAAFDFPAAEAAPAPLREWSGEVYGSVADMRRAIAAGLASESMREPSLGPVDRYARWASRALGWLTLLAAVVAVGVMVA